MNQEPLLDLVQANQQKITDFCNRETALYSSEANQKNARYSLLKHFIQLIRPSGGRIGLINLINQEY